MKEEADTWKYQWLVLLTPTESLYTYLFRNYCDHSSHVTNAGARNVELDHEFSRQIIGTLGISKNCYDSV